MRSIRTRTITQWAGFAALGALIMTSAPLLAAKDEINADARIQAMTVELKKLEVADTRNAATTEVGKAEALRDKARSLVGERKQKEALARTLDELEATVAYAEGKIIEADKQAMFDAKQAELAKARQQLGQVRDTVAQLEKQQQALEAKLGGQ